MSVSASHQAMIEELRTRLQSAGVLEGKFDTDLNLLRWIQGFDFDIEKVYHKLRYHLRFRKAWDQDHILELHVDLPVLKYWPMYVGGPTNKGNNCIVSVDYMGRVDIPGIMKSFSLFEIAKSRAFTHEALLEAVLQQEQATGRQSGVAHIIDLQGMKYDKEMLKILTGPFKDLCIFVSDHTAELLKKIFLVNVPSFMYYLWKIIRPFLAEKIANEIQILGSDWREKLLDYIDADALPIQFGGRLEFTPSFQPPDPVPKSLYWSQTDRENLLLKSEQLEVLQVSAGKSKFITIKVDTVGQILIWKYLSSVDSAMSVFFSENEKEKDLDKMEMVFPQFLSIHGPTPVPFQQKHTCQKPGFYKFWFRNWSWFFSLKVWIIIETIQPH